MRADNDCDTIAPRLDSENQLAVLEPRETEEPVGRPELGGYSVPCVPREDFSATGEIFLFPLQ